MASTISPFFSEVLPGPMPIFSTATVRLPVGPAMAIVAPAATRAGTRAKPALPASSFTASLIVVGASYRIGVFSGCWGQCEDVRRASANRDINRRGGLVNVALPRPVGGWRSLFLSNLPAWRHEGRFRLFFGCREQRQT